MGSRYNCVTVAFESIHGLIENNNATVTHWQRERNCKIGAIDSIHERNAIANANACKGALAVVGIVQLYG